MIRLDDVWPSERLPPVRKLLALVFAMVGKDRARELRFDYHAGPPEARMWYCVTGVAHEMVPPPAILWPEVFWVFWRETRFGPSDRPRWWQRRRRWPSFPDRPVAGTLTVQFGNVPLDFDILFFRGPTGEHIQLQKTSPLDVSQSVTELLSRCVKEQAGPDGMTEL
jgi:hypothetical protein